MKIYVASSWRNLLQPGIVHALRRCGHEVYDFKNPRPGDHGFAWSAIDPDWERWTVEQYRDALKHPVAQAGYASDIDALVKSGKYDSEPFGKPAPIVVPQEDAGFLSQLEGAQSQLGDA